jgi:hypothetical protein
MLQLSLAPRVTCGAVTAACLERSKSVSMMCPLSCKRMFSGLRSLLCVRVCVCACVEERERERETAREREREWSNYMPAEAKSLPVLQFVATKD